MRSLLFTLTFLSAVACEDLRATVHGSGTVVPALGDVIPEEGGPRNLRTSGQRARAANVPQGMNVTHLLAIDANRTDGSSVWKRVGSVSVLARECGSALKACHTDGYIIDCACGDEALWLDLGTGAIGKTVPDQRRRRLHLDDLDSHNVVMSCSTSDSTGSNPTKHDYEAWPDTYGLGLQWCDVLNSGETTHDTTVGNAANAYNYFSETHSDCDSLTAWGKVFGSSQIGKIYVIAKGSNDDHVMQTDLRLTHTWRGSASRHSYWRIWKKYDNDDDGSSRIGSDTQQCTWSVSAGGSYSAGGGTGSYSVAWDCPSLGYGCTESDAYYTCGYLSGSGGSKAISVLTSRYDASTD